MRKFKFLTLLAFAAVLSSPAQISGKCVPLFNGSDLAGWNLEKPGGFEVINGELITRSFGAGYDIFTTMKYGNFILSLEFQLSEVGNSGVFIRRDPSVPGSGFEVQLLAPWTPWRDDLHCTGSMYGHVAVTNRPDETTGKWYKMVIKCDRNVITISVDDKVTTMADIDTVKTMAGKPLSGFIGLQGNHAEKEGQYAKFRDICIVNLDTDPGYVFSGFTIRNELLRNHAREAAVSLGAKMIQSLAGLMTGSDPMAASGARQALFDIAAKASDPSVAVKAKKEVTSEIRKAARTTSSEITANYLKWLSGLVGK